VNSGQWTVSSWQKVRFRSLFTINMFHEETSQVTSPSSVGRPFDMIPAKTSFVIGFVFGILVLCTAGFFFLLPLVFN
jgi:hypothetical protein